MVENIVYRLLAVCTRGPIRYITYCDLVYYVIG